MTGDSEAAADVLTGAVVASTADAEVRPVSHASPHELPTACLNCGAPRLGAYCVECGQPAHIHRSFASLGHDLLHSVFHFEGKFWRTMPELIFHPGRLTRRYIDGERAKFISPMALFLFTVFLMYAIFAFVPNESPGEAPILITDSPALQGAADAEDASGAGEPPDRTVFQSDGLLGRAVEKFKEDPALVAYKVKTNGYKFSWLLVPLSIPFMWLLFFWRREFRLYDHAVFVTYSISFMTLLVVATTLARAAGAAAGIEGALMMLVPPLHIYKQLRGAYGLSRRGALVRLFFVLVAAWIVLSIFLSMLFLMGALE